MEDETSGMVEGEEVVVVVVVGASARGLYQSSAT